MFQNGDEIVQEKFKINSSTSTGKRRSTENEGEVCRYHRKFEKRKKLQASEFWLLKLFILAHKDLERRPIAPSTQQKGMGPPFSPSLPSPTGDLTAVPHELHPLSSPPLEKRGKKNRASQLGWLPPRALPISPPPWPPPLRLAGRFSS